MNFYCYIPLVVDLDDPHGKITAFHFEYCYPLSSQRLFSHDDEYEVIDQTAYFSYEGETYFIGSIEVNRSIPTTSYIRELEIDKKDIAKEINPFEEKHNDQLEGDVEEDEVSLKKNGMINLGAIFRRMTSVFSEGSG